MEVDLTIVITDQLSDNNTILDTKLKNVIRETKKLIESDLEFERRFPRNGLRRRRTRPYRPKWIQNPLLFENALKDVCGFVCVFNQIPFLRNY